MKHQEGSALPRHGSAAVEEGDSRIREGDAAISDQAPAQQANALFVGTGMGAATDPQTRSVVSAAPGTAVTPFKFIPWYRAGAATLIRGSAAADAQSAAHFKTQVDLSVDGSTVSVPVHLFGPADAAGIEAGQILRRTPAPDAPACEPHLFPAVEFREADLPWRLTPVAPATDKDRLWPWLVLIALEQSPELRVRPFGSAPLPRVVAPREELPDLAESPLWAHVQISGPFPPDLAGSSDPVRLAAFVKANPGRATARLLCPRRLAPNTRYLLCLVPAFEIGRRAGLGEEVREEELGLAPAWSSAGAATVSLPVYDHWSITTGAAEDPAAQFERLARALRPHHLPPEAAFQAFEVNFDPEQAPQHTVQLPLQGALRPAGLTVPATPPAVRTQLKAWVNRPADIEDAGGSPQLAPPLYAGRMAAQRRAGVTGSPPWFNDLNLDPAHRIAAAAGAQMVQRHQEALVAEAWRQAGEIAPANDLLRGAQAARSAGRSLKSRFLDRLPPKRLLQVTGAAHARIGAAGAAGGAGGTLAQAVSASDAMPAAFESAYRRLGRTRGPHQRRWLGSTPDMKAAALFDQGYLPFPTDRWEAVHQAELLPGRGWFHDGSDIVQTGDIHSGSFDRAVLAKPGTMYLTGQSQWRDVHWTFKVRADDDDAVGFVFRYQDTGNFYRFSMDAQRGYRRLVKCIGGNFTLLWEDAESFVVGRTYLLRVQAEGARIRIFIDNVLKVDVTDASVATGRLGFYTWGISSARFTPVQLRPQLGFSGFGTAGAGTRRRDEGTLGGASIWTVLEDGTLAQTGTTHSTPTDRDSLAKLGGAIRLPNTGRSDYSVSMGAIMDTDGDCGVMFRMHPTQPSYYRFSVSISGRYMRLVKCLNGVFSLLWQRDEGVRLGHVVDLSITVDGSRISGFVNGRKRFDLRDVSLTTGEAALYMWKSKLRYNRVSMRALRHDSALTTIDTGALDLPALAASASAALDPGQTVVAATLDRLAVGASNSPSATAGTLTPLQVAPDYPQPLVSRLAQEAPHLLLPGLGGIPHSAIVMLEPNPAFIAAFLAGANDEIGRELLWRGFPADPRASPFRQFWDVRGGLHAAATPQQREAHKDIAPIGAWPTDKGLAQQVATRAAGTVFLIRSELMRRFPDARVQLVKAMNAGAGRAPGTVVAPYLFTGRLADDMAYFGFEVPAAQATGADGGAGWYFAIEQQPGATRFGLVLQRDEAPSDWTDVGWNHLGTANYVHSTALTLQPHPPGPRWGRNGAHMAAITRRRPFQLLVHASRLI